MRTLKNTIITEFAAREKKRNTIFDVSRQCIRHCSKAIAAIHRSDEETFTSCFNEAKKIIDNLASLIKNTEFQYHNFVNTAFQEYAECAIFSQIYKNKEIPLPKDLDISIEPYLLGCADAIGEIKRAVLDALCNKNIDEAQRLFKEMNTLYDLIIEVDVPDSMLSGFRHKRDVAHKLIENTREILTNAIIMQRK